MNSTIKLGYYYLVMVIGIFVAGLIIFMIDEAYNISDHPIESLILRVIVFIIIIVPFILRKLYIFVYLSFISFPFMEMRISSISLLAIFSFLLLIIYNREILAKISKDSNHYKIPIIIICICFIYTTILSFYPYDAIKAGLLQFAPLIIYYNILVKYIKTKRELRKIFYIIIAIYVFCNIISILQYLFGIESIKIFIGEYNQNTDIFGFSKRIPSVFWEAQAAGQYYATNIILITGILVEIKKKILFIILIILGINSLLLTISKMAILSFLVVYIFMIIYISIYKNRVNNIIILIIIIIIAPIIYDKVAPEQFKNRFDSIAQKESYDFRKKMWEESIVLIKKYPFGVGLGGKNLYHAAISDGAIDYGLIKKIDERDLTYFHFENSFLSVLYSIGIVGFIGLLILLYKYFKKAAEYIKKGNKNQKYIAISISASMLVWLSCSYTSPLIQEVQPMFIFTILFVLLDKVDLLST